MTAHLTLTAWQFAPVVTAAVGLAAGLYLLAVRRVARDHPARPWPVPRTMSFLAGLLVVALATQSAVGVYDDELLSAHMVQHLMLLMVAPPLLIYGRPVTLALHTSRNPVHRRIKRVVRSSAVTFLTNPVVVTLLFAAVVAGTHLTPIMNVVLTHESVHEAEHCVYLVVGYLFFLPVLGSEPLRRRLSLPGRYLLLIIAMPVDTVVGLILMLAPHPLFSAYTNAHRSWGPSVLADQHLGGALMWMVGDAIMAGFILGISLLFVRTADRAADLDDSRLAAYNDYLRLMDEGSPATSASP